MDSTKDSRNKRLKVGRACYTCRAKKIKCDGLRPCMQCKARNRPCTFYKDGSFDPDQEITDDSMSAQRESKIPTSDSSSNNSSSTGSAVAVAINADQYIVGPPEEPSDSCYLFADTKDSNYTRNKRRGAPLESRTSNILASLGENLRKVSLYDNHAGKTFLDVEPFGNFIKWTAEPPMPSRYTGSIEMPTRTAQMDLLEFHFSDNYETLPIIPKRFFFDQLRTKGPFITPLLLNAIYAQASRFSANSALPKSEVFYHRAKRLLDDFMDIPRVSTVVALCYMSLYERTPPAHRNSSPYCRAWLYSGMAFRMCVELGLHNQSNISKELKPDEIELRKRVYWSCYFLDKIQSAGWERPWMLSSRLANVQLPSEMPEYDEHERRVLQCFNEKVKYAQLLEDRLIESCIPQQQQQQQQRGTKTSNGAKNGSNSSNGSNGSNGEKNKEDSCSYTFAKYLRRFPPDLQWTPTSTLSVDQVMRLPAPHPRIAHLHIHYNLSILDELFRAPNNAFNQFQRRITATCMTQLVDFVCDRPGSAIKFDFLVHSILAAIKVHVRHLYSADVNIARQSWVLFEKSIMVMHKIQKFVVIPNASKFLQNLSNNVEGGNLSIGSTQSVERVNNSANGQHQLEQQPMVTMATTTVSQVSTSIATTMADSFGDIYTNIDRSAAIAAAAATGGFHSDQSNGDYVVMSMTSHNSQQGWPNSPPLLPHQQQQLQHQQRPQQQPNGPPSPTPLIINQNIAQNMSVMGQKGSDMMQLPPELMMQSSHSTPAASVSGAGHALFSVPSMSQHNPQSHSQRQQQQHHHHHQDLWDYHQE